MPSSKDNETKLSEDFPKIVTEVHKELIPEPPHAFNSIFTTINLLTVSASKPLEATNRFAGDVYKEITKNESGNIVFSPLCAEVILSLLYCVTGGDLAEELATALHLSGDKKEIINDTKNFLQYREYYQLAVAVFAERRLAWKESFLEVAEDYFFTEAKHLNFAKNKEAADTINEFVEHHTGQSIKNLISPASLNDAIGIVLVNALGFRKNWAISFSPYHTRTENFYAANRVIKVDYLHHQVMEHRYYESADFKAKFLALSLVSEADMVFILPTEKNGLSNLEKRIGEIVTFKIPFEQTYTKVAVPKFKLEYHIDFKKILTELGVSKIFDISQADLSGIAGQKGDAVVSKVVQKANIDLNERGLGSTEGKLYSRVWGVHVADLKTFVANQPFIFLVKAHGTTIFAGRVVEPKY